MTTVIDHFGLTLICWRDKGDCKAFHYSHIHVSLGKDYNNARPKCDGGSAGFTGPSPEMVTFRDEIYRRFPKLHAPGGGDGILACRKVAGSSSWSNHAYGTAIDVTTDGSSSELIDYLNKVYDWINGPWKEEVEDVTPTQDTMLRREWFYRAGKADALGIKRPGSPEQDDGVVAKGWSNEVAKAEIALLKKAVGP